MDFAKQKTEGLSLRGIYDAVAILPPSDEGGGPPKVVEGEIECAAGTPYFFTITSYLLLKKAPIGAHSIEQNRFLRLNSLCLIVAKPWNTQMYEWKTCVVLPVFQYVLIKSVINTRTKIQNKVFALLGIFLFYILPVKSVL